MIKKTVLLFLVHLILISCGTRQNDSFSNTPVKPFLDSLYVNHQYFRLREQFEKHSSTLTEKDRLLLQAKIHSVFNNRLASNKLIDRLLGDHLKALSPTDHIDLLETRINNSLFQFKYEEALLATQVLLSSGLLKQEEKIKAHRNTEIIYKTLQQVPKQEIKLEKSKLPITKDAAGLFRIPVILNTTEEEVVFDTGANISVITQSLALKSGMKVIGEAFKVKAITGGEVDSRIAVAETLKVGNTILRNVVFLVFPEASLSFPEADFTIDAILGFPVINALKEIIIVKGEELHITGAPSQPGPQNLALDFLTPIVEVHQNGRSLPFSFDTGANSTSLYEDYFQLHKNNIEKNGRRDTLRFGGAGGVVEMPVYYHTFSGRIGERDFELKNVAVHQKNVRDTRGIYGNLGQDLLRQSDTLVMDFEDMNFILK